MVATEEKFVILHSGVGRYKRGDVVTADDLGGGIDRLRAHQAIRDAYPAEASQKHVDLAASPQEMSFQHKLADKDQLIAALRSQVHELQQQLSAARPSAPAVNAAALDQAAAMLRQKDSAILDLQSRLHLAEQSQQGHDALVREVHELRQKLADHQEGAAAIQARIAEAGSKKGPK